MADLYESSAKAAAEVGEYFPRILSISGDGFLYEFSFFYCIFHYFVL